MEGIVDSQFFKDHHLYHLTKREYILLYSFFKSLEEFGWHGSYTLSELDDYEVNSLVFRFNCIQMMNLCYIIGGQSVINPYIANSHLTPILNAGERDHFFARVAEILREHQVEYQRDTINQEINTLLEIYGYHEKMMMIVIGFRVIGDFKLIGWRPQMLY